MNEAAAPVKKRRKFVFPQAFAVMMILALIFAVLSYVIPSSTYGMKDVTYVLSDGTEKTRAVVDPTTWARSAEDKNVTVMQYLTSFMRGMEQTSDIIFYIFLVVGCFYILNETGALTAGIGRLTKALGKRQILIIPILTVIFAALGSTAGIFEEMLCFIPIFIPIFVSMGYDSLLCVGVVLGGCTAGWAGTITNPFTLGVSQGIAGVPVFSGLGFHAICFVAFTSVTTIWLTRYAIRVKKDPDISLMREFDLNRDESQRVDLESLPEFTLRRKLILILFFLTIGVMLYGVLKLGWYFEELVALFLVMGVLTAFIYGKDLNWFCDQLTIGMQSIVGGALIVGFARAILVVMNDGEILHTILHGMAGAVQKLPSYLTVVGQYVFQNVMSFIIPSGSGLATATMPIMAPLSDLTGITRQTAVLCEVIGDALSNVYTPTSGPLLAGLALASIPYVKWAKYWWKIILIQSGIGLVMVLIAQAIQFGPF